MTFDANGWVIRYSNTVVKMDNGTGYDVTATVNSWWSMTSYGYEINGKNQLVVEIVSNPQYTQDSRINQQTLATAMMDASKSKNANNLIGRTVNGIDVEMQLHYSIAAQLEGNARLKGLYDHFATVDIGGAIPSTRDYDWNGFAWERLAVGSAQTSVFLPWYIR
jgi:hypothetical protein